MRWNTDDDRDTERLCIERESETERDEEKKGGMTEQGEEREREMDGVG